MRDTRTGAAFRAVRIRRGWRQADVAARARVSRWVVSQIERGEIGRMSLDTVERVAAALEMRLQVIARWRGGDLDRLLNARHSAFHELVARYLSSADGWVFVPEVSFSIVGERGVIDILAWHPASRALLVIELKTEIPDIQEAMGTLDRKKRLALRVARERGWHASSVSVWMIVAEGTANRRRITSHRTTLRAALPADGWAMRQWLHEPTGRPIAGLSLWSNAGGSSAKLSLAAHKRVRVRRVAHGHAQPAPGGLSEPRNSGVSLT